MAMMPSICDPDTSDEEENMSKKLSSPKQKPKKGQKSTKMIEAKPIRVILFRLSIQTKLCDVINVIIKFLESL